MSDNKKTNDGILAGVVVLDLTQMLAGPYCTMILADHGADVIKIEPPHGDMSRGLGPYAELDIKKENSGYFHSINRNKRSIILNLKMATDREIFFSNGRKIRHCHRKLSRWCHGASGIVLRKITRGQ